MSHLYGFISSLPAKVDCSLIQSQRALVRLSYADSRNVSRVDGWGLALFDGETPHAQRRTISHPEKQIFDSLDSRDHANAAIAHLRRGTVGKPDKKSVHPFTFESWAFAHRGTVENFTTIRRELLGELTPEFRRAVLGSTDSEHIFYLFLSYLKRSAGSIAGDAPIHRIRDSFRKSISMLNEWSNRTGTRIDSGLTLLATNRRAFLACRQRSSLYYVERDRLETCPICGEPHSITDPEHPYRSVVISSEPLTGEDWNEIPERHIMLIDPDLTVTIAPIEE